MSNAGPSPWTEDLTARLLELVGRMAIDPDYHFSDVALELGMGRNAIVGKVERLRRKGHPIPSLTDRLRRPSMKPPRPRIKPVTLATVPPADEYVPLVDANLQPAAADWPAPVLEPGRYTLLDLEDDRCHWPLGDRPPFLFCGAAGCSVTAGSPYCRAHARIAYNPRP